MGVQTHNSALLYSSMSLSVPLSLVSRYLPVTHLSNIIQCIDLGVTIEKLTNHRHPLAFRHIS